MFEINNAILQPEFIEMVPINEAGPNADIMKELERYKSFYNKQMQHIQNWKNRNNEKVNIYHKQYYHTHLKAEPTFIEKMKSAERKAIVHNSYEKHKDKYKAQKLEKNPSPKPRGRPKKLINVIVPIDDKNINVLQNEII